MSDDSKLIISYVLCYLRQELVDARENKNTKLLTELGNTFDIIEAAALKVGDSKIAAIAEELRSAVRDTFMGSEWKSNIPSEDEIKLASQ